MPLNKLTCLNKLTWVSRLPTNNNKQMPTRVELVLLKKILRIGGLIVKIFFIQRKVDALLPVLFDEVC